ncbi:hypothetical protein [Hyphococcus sp.]|uniref:hypothetical protein n=1 Tax=Hyphococcus sp. TaxID=2038636 RepID=UPI0035C77E54
MNTNLANQFLSALGGDPGVFPHQYAPAMDQILLARLPVATLREASFLDERILTRETQGVWIPAQQVAAAAAALPSAPVSYIFHSGHCGSTLVSRLLGAAGDAIALREPLPLRALAFDRAEGGGAMLTPEKARERLSLLERLWARGASAAVVKATSICTGLAADLLPAGAKAVYVSQRADIHLAVLLAGRNAVNDLRAFAQMRWRRLNAHIPLPPLAQFSNGELAALCWLAETDAAARARLPVFDFDALLTAPAETLGAIATALGVAAPEDKIAAAIAGPIMKRYSKSPDHEYDAALRARIIADARRDHGAEIQKGLDWLDRLGAASPSAKAVLDRWT